jgi:hypothetical protein
MWIDSIVEEISKIRKARASVFDYNIRAIIEDARKRQKKSKHHIVSIVSRKQRAS